MDTQKAAALLSSLSEYTLTEGALSCTKLSECIEGLIEKNLALASIAVYPAMVDDAGVALGNSNTPVVALCGAFPAGQTYLEVKLLEIAMAIENGADEIEVLINVGEALEGRMDAVGAELRILAEEVGDSTDALFRVNLAAGALGGDAALLMEVAREAIDAGAQMLSIDFCDEFSDESLDAILALLSRNFKENSQIVGLRLGGLPSVDAYLEMLKKVKATLGEQWLRPEFLRCGVRVCTGQ